MNPLERAAWEFLLDHDPCSSVDFLESFAQPDPRYDSIALTVCCSDRRFRDVEIEHEDDELSFVDGTPDRLAWGLT